MAALALVAGILILIMPRLLNYVVALYLIVIGILGLIAYFRARGRAAGVRRSVVVYGHGDLLARLGPACEIPAL